MEYPINVFTDIYRQEHAESINKVVEHAEKHEWEKLLDAIKGDDVNRTRLPVRNKSNESPPSLFTPLHHASEGKAPKGVFEALLEAGASKSLKTLDGETACDIGKRQNLDPDVLELIKIPKDIKQNENQIKNMEAGLHQVIKERVVELVNKNGQQLPQLSFLFEKGSFYYPVPGMYGGFNVSQHEKGIQADSWIRVCGGSEMNHLIERDGKVTLLPNDNPL